MDNRLLHGKPWSATVTHATASKITQTAVAGRTFLLSELSVRSDKAGALVLVKDGTTVIWQFGIGATAHSKVFQIPLRATKGALLSVEVDSTSVSEVNAQGVYED